MVAQIGEAAAAETEEALLSGARKRADPVRWQSVGVTPEHFQLLTVWKVRESSGRRMLQSKSLQVSKTSKRSQGRQVVALACVDPPEGYAVGNVV